MKATINVSIERGMEFHIGQVLDVNARAIVLAIEGERVLIAAHGDETALGSTAEVTFDISEISFKTIFQRSPKP